MGFRSVQIHPAKVTTRKGYPSAGSGAEVGNKALPQRIRPADTANSTAATIAVKRIHRPKVLGVLIMIRAAAHRLIPPTYDGTLASRPAALPARIRLSPATKIKNPAATQSFPCR